MWLQMRKVYSFKLIIFSNYSAISYLITDRKLFSHGMPDEISNPVLKLLEQGLATSSREKKCAICIFIIDFCTFLIFKLLFPSLN